MTSNGRVAWPHYGLLAVLVLAALLAIRVETVRAGEIIPSVGMTRSPGHGDQAKLSGGLAVRGVVVPMLEAEVGATYRRETRLNGQLDVDMWPVTASLWFSPVRAIYAGGGVGWYYSTFRYADALGIPDKTHQQFGTHLGGGLRVPLSEAVAVDLGGRYVWLHSQEKDPIVPSEFNPNYWTTSLGLAFKF